MDNENDGSSDITLIPVGSTPEKIETSIAAFSKPLARLLEHIGLPTDNILSPVEERRKVIYSLESTIEILPLEQRSKSVYLSKFTVAISVGLFDGAINFLWDETIKALRRLVIAFDIHYFFGVACTINNKYKSLNSPDDLTAIGDHDLLEVCRRIGLINDINHKRLEHVNYLRNHASAAHPNDNSITGIEILGMLETCLRYAIIAKPDHSVIQVKVLFDNIRSKEIPNEDFPHIGADLSKNPQERVEDLVLQLSGLYFDTRTDSKVRVNIDKLILYIWGYVSEDTKYYIGSKFGLFRKNGEVERKDLVQKFLDIVSGQKYKDEDSLTAELIEKLQNLKTVHFEWNNFYNEYAHVKSLKSSIPSTGIPDSVRKLFVKVICLCYIGNGRGYREGIDENAAEYYKQFVNQFSLNEIKDFIFLFDDQEFVTDFYLPKPQSRAKRLSLKLSNMSKDSYINQILNFIINFRGSLQDISKDSRFKELVKFIR